MEKQTILPSQIRIMKMYLGTMHSGKSRELIKDMQQDAFPFKFLITPTLVENKAKIIQVHTTTGSDDFLIQGNIFSIQDELNRAKKDKSTSSICLYCDEIQFFSSAEVNQIFDIIKNYNNVYFKLSGLEKDYLNRDFQAIKLIKEKANQNNLDTNTTHLSCTCEECKNNKAEYNCLFNKKQEIILKEGSSGVFNLETESKPKYKVLCQSCFNKEKLKLKSKTNKKEFSYGN